MKIKTILRNQVIGLQQWWFSNIFTPGILEDQLIGNTSTVTRPLSVISTDQTVDFKHVLFLSKGLASVTCPLLRLPVGLAVDW